MGWNYRIINHGDHLALHEVHYRADGTPECYTSGPATFVADPDEGPDGIQKALRMALDDAVQRPVLSVSDFGPPEGAPN